MGSESVSRFDLTDYFGASSCFALAARQLVAAGHRTVQKARTKTAY